MKTLVHASAGVIAMLLAIFYLVAISVAQFAYTPLDMISIQQAILQSMWVYIPLILMTGGVGLVLSRDRQGRIVESKKKRMMVIVSCSLLILLPSVYAMAVRDPNKDVGNLMQAIQALEVLTLMLLIVLLGLNFRDGSRLTANRPTAQ